MDETSEHAARGHPTGLLACSRDPTQSRCSERPPVRPGVSRRKGGGGIEHPPLPYLAKDPPGRPGSGAPFQREYPHPKNPPYSRKKPERLTDFFCLFRPVHPKGGASSHSGLSPLPLGFRAGGGGR